MTTDAALLDRSAMLLVAGLTSGAEQPRHFSCSVGPEDIVRPGMRVSGRPPRQCAFPERRVQLRATVTAGGGTGGSTDERGLGHGQRNEADLSNVECRKRLRRRKGQAGSLPYAGIAAV